MSKSMEDLINYQDFVHIQKAALGLTTTSLGKAMHADPRATTSTILFITMILEEAKRLGIDLLELDSPELSMFLTRTASLAKMVEENPAISQKVKELFSDETGVIIDAASDASNALDSIQARLVSVYNEFGGDKDGQVFILGALLGDTDQALAMVDLDSGSGKQALEATLESIEEETGIPAAVIESVLRNAQLSARKKVSSPNNTGMTLSELLKAAGLAENPEEATEFQSAKHFVEEPSSIEVHTMTTIKIDSPEKLTTLLEALPASARDQLIEALKKLSEDADN